MNVRLFALPLALLAACTNPDDRADLGLDSVGDVIDGEFIVQSRLSEREMEQLGVEELDWSDGLNAGLYVAIDDSVSVSGLRRALDAHSRGGGGVESNRPMKAFAPNDSYYNYQWDMKKWQVDTAWTYSTGTGVKVAVIDTGVWTGGTDKPVNLVAGYDFIGNDSNPTDENGHGTHVAGTIAQASNNGRGCVGVAPNAQIMPIRVLDANGSGDSYSVANGIQWATDHGAQVINMSLGSSYSTSIESSAVADAVSQGIVVVAATGNEGASAVGYPASYDGVIAVGATRYDDSVAYYSNGGSKIDLVAPGGDMSVDQDRDGYADGILQETVSGGRSSFEFYEGTSMATPHVAGAAALLLAAGARPQDVQGLLTSTAKDVGTSGWDTRAGYGLVQPVAALQKLQTSGGGSGGGNTTPPPPQVDTTPPTISNVTASRSGSSLTISWTTNEPASSWITFQGYGTYGDDNLVTQHTSRFTISSSRSYTFSIESDDANDNAATTGWYTSSR